MNLLINGKPSVFVSLLPPEQVCQQLRSTTYFTRWASAAMGIGKEYHQVNILELLDSLSDGWHSLDELVQQAGIVAQETQHRFLGREHLLSELRQAYRSGDVAYKRFENMNYFRRRKF